LLSVTIANAVNATLYDNLSYNFIRDSAPVSGTIRVANVAYVHPSVPAKTIPELIAYAQGQSGRTTWLRPATERRPTWPANCSR